MKRVLAFIGAGVLALLLVPATPANAYMTPAGCAQKSGFGYNVQVCAVYHWRYQNDGTGVHVESVNVYTVNSCDELESKAFESLYVTTLDSGDHRNIGDQYDCSVVWDLELNGSDRGSTTVVTSGNANVDLANDFDFSLYCNIKPNNPDECWGTP